MSDSSTARSRQFLAFVNALKDDDVMKKLNTERQMRGRLKNSDEIHYPLATNKQQQRLMRKINHMKRITSLLEKTLLDKQVEFEEKQNFTKVEAIEWMLSNEVSMEFEESLSKTDCVQLSRRFSKHVESCKHYFAKELSICEEVKSIATRRDSESSHAVCEKSENLLEAEATVRYLDYIKYVNSSLENCLSPNDATMLQNCRDEALKRIELSDSNLTHLRRKLHSLVKRRLSEEITLKSNRLQKEKIGKLNRSIEMRKRLDQRLQQQRVRFEAIRLSVDSDFKNLQTLQRRAAMIDQLLQNDVKTIKRITDMSSFCEDESFQLPSDQTIDQKDNLLLSLTNLLNMKENNAGTENNTSLKCLTFSAYRSQELFRKRLKDLSSIFRQLQNGAHQSELLLTSLVAECNRMNETSNTKTVHEYLRLSDKHKSKVSALLSDSKVKVETRDGINGEDALKKLKFATAEKSFIDLILHLCDESTTLPLTKDLECQIMASLGHNDEFEPV